jgi:2-polyprenyl-3-methyl-5-hydroxy-6-metoxy-1,4-benzoquinol methylase
MKAAVERFSPVPLEVVRDFWNSRPCNIRHSPRQLGTLEYFEDVRQRKYFVEPHIPQFAEFGRWDGRRVLEIGCGIGTDTISFAQAGASVTAIDLSERSLEIARQCAKVYGVADRVRFIRANAERLSESLSPEPFDLIYSFGVIHHTPHPEFAIAEMRKFAVPGTTLKVMVYNRYSWRVFAIVVGSGRGRFWNLDQLVSELSEAQTGCPVTYSYSRRAARQLLQHHGFNVVGCRVEHIFPYRVEEYTHYRYVRQWKFQVIPPPLFRWLERRVGWHLCLTARV